MLLAYQTCRFCMHADCSIYRYRYRYRSMMDGLDDDDGWLTVSMRRQRRECWSWDPYLWRIFCRECRKTLPSQGIETCSQSLLTGLVLGYTCTLIFVSVGALPIRIPRWSQCNCGHTVIPSGYTHTGYWILLELIKKRKTLSFFLRTLAA